MLDVLLTILKAVWWLFNATGSAAAMFCLASLLGYAAGKIKNQYPNFVTHRKTTSTEMALWLIVLTLICAVPILNWIIAIALFCNDDEFVDLIVNDTKTKYGLDEEM